MWIELEILKNRAKLERMIINNEDYKKILEQSRKLDDYINIKIREQRLEIMKIKSKNNLSN